MRILRQLRNYFCYCGIEKDEYNAVKKDAYVSNFAVWRILHLLITVTFAFLFIASLLSGMMSSNRIFYMVAFIYYAIATVFFFIIKKNSIIAQFLIYLSISVLFLFGCFIAQNQADYPATTFMVLILITPMFMIDKPYFMALELTVASAVFLVWMHAVKSPEIWKIDVANTATYLFVGIFIHIIANSLRIKEFVLTRKLNIQKDTDDLTGIKNKGALTREINGFLTDGATDKGIMFLIDINYFKSINDTYGHDVGDGVIRQIGGFLGKRFVDNEIVGRFGGDEFIIFVKDTDSTDAAREIARSVVAGIAENVKLPDRDKTVSVSIGIAIYHGAEKNYSEIFKKADIALYKTKSDRTVPFCFYEEAIG